LPGTRRFRSTSCSMRWPNSAADGRPPHAAITRASAAMRASGIFAQSSEDPSRLSRTALAMETRARGRAMVGIHFAAAGCQACPARPKCTRAKAGYRSLLLQSREEHEAIREARRRRETEGFKADYARRAGIEGTLSQGVRA